MHALCDDVVRAGVDLGVSPADEMARLFYFRHGQDRERALVMYFSSGRAIWAALRRVLVWHFGALDRIGRLLDFAAGYGRVTRFAAAELPPARAVAADIDAGAVAFQRRRLGVEGVLSAADPDRLALAGEFDAILVSSLFTHLPERSFARWLARLGSHLAPRGLLLFSVHDVALLEGERPAADFVFRAESETERLDKAEYGTAWVSEGYVRRVLASALPGRAVHREPLALAGFQDLYVVAPAGSDFSGLELPRVLDHAIDRFGVDADNALAVSGWVAWRSPAARATEIRLARGAEVVARQSAFLDRPDLRAFFPGQRLEAAGFALEARLGPGWSPAEEVALAVVCADGEEVALVSGRLESALARAARVALARAHDELEVKRRELLELETRLAAMRASRFWKLRDAWFALKRALGLTAER